MGHVPSSPPASPEVNQGRSHPLPMSHPPHSADTEDHEEREGTQKGQAWQSREAVNMEKRENKGPQNRASRSSLVLRPAFAPSPLLFQHSPLRQWLLTHLEAPQGMEAESKELSS